MPPVTWFVELTVTVAEPVSVEPFTPLAKHAPALMKLKPVMSSGTLAPLFTVKVKAVTKFNWLAAPVPPVNWASQFPVVDVVTVVEGLLVPQLQTAISSASSIRIASFFMYRPCDLGSLSE